MNVEKANKERQKKGALRIPEREKKRFQWTSSGIKVCVKTTKWRKKRKKREKNVPLAYVDRSHKRVRVRAKAAKRISKHE